MKTHHFLFFFALFLVVGCKPEADPELNEIKQMSIHPDMYKEIVKKSEGRETAALWNTIIPIHQRKIIWSSLSDSTKDVEEAIGLIEKYDLTRTRQSIPELKLDTFSVIQSIFLAYDIYLTFCRKGEKLSKPTLARMNGALNKIILDLPEFFDKEIIYDGVMDASFGSRYIFLEGGELRTYNSLGFVSVTFCQWHSSNDTITIIDDDTTQYSLTPKGLFPIEGYYRIIFRDSL